MAVTQQYSFLNYPKKWIVSCLGTDISFYVKEVRGLGTSLDYPQLTKYTSSNVDIRIRNDNDFFSAFNTNNFFVQNSGHQDGIRSSILIQAGYELPDGTFSLERLFVGEILNIDEDPQGSELVFKVTNPIQRLHKDNVTDFGLSRNITLEAMGSTRNGRYPILDALQEVSEDSNTAYQGSTELTEVPELRTEGNLDPTNYVIEEDALYTEGGLLSSDPRLTFKSPYRNKKVETLVTLILDHYNITDRILEFTEPEVPAHFSTTGRVGYDTDFNDARVAEWSGLPTDFVLDATNQRFYFLYSGFSSTTRPKLIVYNISSDSFEIRYTHTAFQQWWGLAANSTFTTFYILGTTGTGHTARGLYNSGDSGVTSQVHIWQLNTATNTLSDYITPSDTFRPQLGNKFFFQDVADTRKGFEFHNGKLYYIFCNNTRVGVASKQGTNAAVEEGAINRDSRGNSTAVDFAIHGNTLYFLWKFGTASNTRVWIGRKTLS